MTRTSDAPAAEVNGVVRKRLDTSQHVVGARFENDSLRACSQRLLGQFLRLVHRQQKDLRVGSFFEDLTCRFEAVDLRHRHVQQDDIGPEAQRLRDCFASVGSLAAQFPLRM